MKIKPETLVLMILKDRIRKSTKTYYGRGELVTLLDNFEAELER